MSDEDKQRRFPCVDGKGARQSYPLFAQADIFPGGLSSPCNPPITEDYDCCNRSGLCSLEAGLCTSKGNLLARLKGAEDAV